MGQVEIADEVLYAPQVTVRDDDPDHAIVKLVNAGRLHDALTALMQRYGGAVARFCGEALRDAALGDDVSQQVFIQAHRDLSRFRGGSNLRTWLFAIANHRVLDAAKARRRAQAHLDDADGADIPDPTPSAGERIDDGALVRALQHCLGEIPAGLRNELLLRYQQGLTFEEIATISGVRPGTLQARITRLLPRLQACIEARTSKRV
jgi:RNA polymerase sigma-70 factor (ECF subfamily)